jgi:hypothetical protein
MKQVQGNCGHTTARSHGLALGNAISNGNNEVPWLMAPLHRKIAVNGDTSQSLALKSNAPNSILWLARLRARGVKAAKKVAAQAIVLSFGKGRIMPKKQALRVAPIVT